MPNEHTRNLVRVRQRFVDARRLLIERLLDQSSRPEDHAGDVKALQDAIAAIDRAVADEEDLAQTVVAARDRTDSTTA